MAHVGLDLRLLSYVLLRQWLRGVLYILRIFFTLAFEVLAGFLLAANVIWNTLLIHAVWRCILFVRTSLRCAQESTRELKMKVVNKKFLGSAEVGLESLSDDPLPRWRNETAIVLVERSCPSFPMVQLFAADDCGYGLDGIPHSKATTSCASSHWRWPDSFLFSEELTAHARDAYLVKECVFQLGELSSTLQCSIENITSMPTSPSKFSVLGFGETPFDAIQFSIPQQICASLQSMWRVWPDCVATDDLSQLNKARLNAIIISRPNTHDGVPEPGHHLIVVKHPAYSVMRRVHMDWMAGILSISRCGGAVLTRNLNEWMPGTIISSLQLESNGEQFPATAKLALQERSMLSRTRGPALWTGAFEKTFDGHLQLHCSHGESVQPLQMSEILQTPPVQAGKFLEIVDSWQQACIKMSVPETLQKIDEESKQEQPLQQTWWDEDAVLLGDEGEEICDGFEQWKPLSKGRSKSLFSVCKTVMTSLASLSSKSSR